MRLKLPFCIHIAVLVGLMSGLQLHAQDKKTYRGAYEFYGFEGRAVYDYLKFRKDSTLKDGDFGFVRKHTDEEDLRIFNRMQATGAYKLGTKSGPWEYLESNNRVVINDIVFFNVKASLESTQFETKANYDTSGAPQGRWSYKVLSYKDEVISDLLSSKQLNFKQGDISGKFTFETDDKQGYYGLYSLEGHCSTGGLMDSLWVFRYMRDTLQILEHRYYTDGFLTEVVKISGNGRNDTLFHSVDRATRSKLAVLRNGGTALFKVSDRNFGIDYISGFDESDKRYLTQTHGNGYLKELFDAITKFDTDFYYHEGKEVNSPLKTKRFEFKAVPEDDSLRSDIENKYLALTAMISELFESNTFGLNYKRTDSLYYANQYFQLLDSLTDKLFYPINKVVSDEFKYFDTYAYSEEHNFEFMTVDTVRIQSGGTEFAIAPDFNAGLDPNARLTKRMHHYLNLMYERARILRVSVNEQMKLIKIGDELEALQERIIEERQKINKEIDRLSFYSGKQASMYESMADNFIDKKFEAFKDAYGKDEMEAGKVDKANEYLEVLSTIKDLISPLTLPHPNQDKLDSLYLEEVFNPFTYSSYKRRVKEDLYKKGEKLFDHYIASLEEEEDHQQLQKTLDKIKALHLRMEKLRSSDSRSLERSLRGARTPEEIEKLLVRNDE